MIALFVIVMMIIDIMIVGVFLVKAITSIGFSKTASGRCFWLLMTSITLGYILIAYKIIILDYFDSGISILYYPIVITVIYWLISKFKKR